MLQISSRSLAFVSVEVGYKEEKEVPGWLEMIVYCVSSGGGESQDLEDFVAPNSTYT